MINISEIVADWPCVDGWRVSHGVEWCATGNRVRVGDNVWGGSGVEVGDRVLIGNNTTFGDQAKMHDQSWIGAGAIIGDFAWVSELVVVEDCAQIGRQAIVGYSSRIGRNSIIGDGMHTGDIARVPDDATFICDIGSAGGCRMTLSSISGIAHISNLNESVTLADALLLWPRRSDGSTFLCLLESAKALANLHKLRWE